MSTTLSPTVVRGACPHDCPDRCTWLVTVSDGVATKLVGDPEHPFTRGGLCAKVNHYLDRVYSPDRVVHPLRRVGPKGSGEFEQVTWDEALDAISKRLQQIIIADGPTAVLPYSYLGTQGIIQGSSIDRRFFARLGATRLERAVCGSAGGSGVAATNGTIDGIVPEDIVHSRFIILWGTNTIVTNLHLWPFIRQAREDGATIVVIDPAKTRTARAADWHIRPLPGTDAALALGLMHVIVDEELHDADYVERYTVGFDALRERLREYRPEKVATITGLDADEIVRLARAYATTRPSTIRTLIGMEHHANGAMMFRTIACLPSLIGAWRERGGGHLHLTAGWHGQAFDRGVASMPQLEDSSIRSVNMVQVGRALIDPDLDPPIKALFVYNSNPAAIAPNQQLVLRGLGREDLFTVVHEQFMTDTARYADYVLPATTELEHWELHYSWGHTYVSMTQPAIEPYGEAIPNTELFRRLAGQMGFDDSYFKESDQDMIRAILDSEHPYAEGITFERLLDEGWAPLNLPEDFRPFSDGGFPTPSGKCEFYSEALAALGLDPLPAFTPAAESASGDRELIGRHPLVLISNKSALHFLNSSYANMPHHLRAEGEPVLDMHPDDARSRTIDDGDQVRVFNDRGSLQLRVRVGDGVRPGVVAMPSGWWPSLSPGGASANTLTADGLSDLGGGGDFHDTLVEVARLET